MTTLADLAVGNEFLFIGQVTALDPVAGLSLSLFGPASAQAGSAVISPAGAMSGQLAAAPNQVPVTIVTGFAPVSVGDVLQNNRSGETLVCRWSQIGPDGSVTWASAASHQVIYTGQGWTTVGHVTL
ncbi:MAG TPA: hypothetical protein VK817_00730 [Trebonia sp.]|nr:hypothetical protein [Trebonia sp.]